MNSYDDRLEDLLLHKDFSALAGEEKAHALACMGSAEAYAAARAMRLRSREVLAGEEAPADPGGLAVVMGRVRRKQRAVVPLWQAAAGVALVALLAWWGRGMVESEPVERGGMIAAVDTVVQEVRVVDTVYLPAPPQDAPSISPTPQKSSTSPRPKRIAPKPTPPDYIAAVVAQLPEPGIANQTAGSPAASASKLPAIEVYGDKFKGGF